MSETPATMSAGQAERLSDLFDAHSDRLYRLARRLTANADDALDLVQETFLRVARSSRPVPAGSTNEEAWLVRILVNVRRDQWRRDGVRKSYERQLSQAISPDENPEKSFVRRRSVWRALDHLRPRRRAVLVMHEIEGLPIASIASLLGISAITVRWHLSRGRRELARLLTSELGGTDAPQSRESLAGRRSDPSRSVAP